MKKQETVLVTGGAGFIGSYVNKLLHEAGYKTIVLDNLSRGVKESVEYGQLITGDLADKSLLRSIFSQHPLSAVIHFAAYIDVGESVMNPMLYYRNNVINTLNLLDVMIEHGVLQLIFSSTAAVYGNPKQLKINEIHPLEPINPYGQSKLMTEKSLADFDKAYGLRFCSLRYFNAAGGDPEGIIKHNQSRSKNLIPTILRSLLDSTKSITVFGDDYPTHDGTCVRDFIHIHDLAEAHLLALKNLKNGCSSNVYNLGNGNGFSIREVLHATERVLEKKVRTQLGPRREGDPAILLADASKAKEEMGWKPRFGLEAMILHAWESLKNG